MAEGRERQQRQPRLIAEPARDAGGLDGDLGDLVRLRHLSDRGVGHQHGAPARHHQRDADHAVAGLGIDHALHIRECDREITGHAGHHGVGIAERNHAGGEMVAVLVDQALAIAQQIAAPLQPLVQEVEVDGVAGRHASIDDLDAFAELDAGLACGLAHQVLAADQQRGPQPLVHETGRGADYLLFLALREHHTFRLSAQPCEDLHQRSGDRIAPRVQLLAVGVHVDDRLAGDAGIHGRLGDGGRHRGNKPRVERHRDDVFRSVFRPCPVQGGDFVGHVLARQIGERVRGGDLHLHIDGGGAHVERAAENEREAENIIDLIGIVGAAGGHDGVVAHLRHFLGGNLGVGIGQGEDDRLGRHRLDHVRGESPLGRESEGHIGALERLCQRARRGLDRVARLPLVHAFGAALIDHALGVAQDQVFGLEAYRLEQFEAGDAGGAGAVADQLGVLNVAPGQIERIDQSGGGDNRGAVLVVMEHRDVHQFAQALLDDEAFRRLDVFEIDAAPAGAEIADAIDELVGVLGGDFQIDGVDVGEAFE